MVVFLLAIVLIFLPLGAAMADTISGFVDETYTSLSTTTKDTSGR